LTSGIVMEALLLEKHSTIGQKEELLKSRPQSFRYIVFNNYKIGYWVNENKGVINRGPYSTNPIFNLAIKLFFFFGVQSDFFGFSSGFIWGSFGVCSDNKKIKVPHC
jgi:hypothetical protein